MQRVHAWLAPFTWEMVTAQNAVLCAAKNALHKPTSDGHARTKHLWESRHRQPMPLDEAVELCRRCHRLKTTRGDARGFVQTDDFGLGLANRAGVFFGP